MHDQNKISEILLSVARMEIQIGRLVSDAESEKEVRKRALDDMESRLRKAEAFINNLKGRMFVTGLLAGGAITLIVWVITK
jgi:hypothetical protein